MTSQSMSRIDALYEAAQKATPGPWREDFGSIRSGSLYVVTTGGDTAVGKRDGEFIALADPQTVMALVEAYRAAKDVDLARVAVDEHVAECDTACRTFLDLNDLYMRGLNDLRAAIEKVESL